MYEGPALEYIDTGLAAGTTYYYKVQAKNPAGTSDLSGNIEASTKLGVPPNFQATGNTTTSVNLNWGSSQNAASYVVEKKLTENGTYVDAYSGNATSCTLNNLDAGAVYYFRIKALNSISNSDYSTQIRVNLSVSPPSVPESGVITSGTQNSLTYSWSNVNGATSYNVYRSSTENGIYTKVGNSIVNIPFTDTGLQPGTRYYYKVTSLVSVLDAGTPINLESGKSNSSNGITIPPNPSNLSITNRTSTSISINCPVVTGADNYKIFKREGSSGSFDEVRTQDIQVSGTTFNVNGLSPSTQYAFKMAASNVTGASGYSSEISASTTALPVFSITLVPSPANGGSVSGGGSFPVGTSITISASPNSGWSFTQWNDGNTNASRTITVPSGGATYTAYFVQHSAITLVPSPANGGSVSGGGSFPVGTSRTISASPNSGWSFTQWNDGNTNASRTITVPPGGATYTAYFDINPVLITVVASPSNGGSVSGGGNFIPGTSRTITANPYSGWIFTQWNDGNTNASRTINVPPGGATYTAYFVQNNATITLVPSPANGGSVSGGGSFPVGTSRTISASPNSGWSFTQWNDGNTNATRTINVPPGGATYTASFIRMQADLWVKNLSITLPDGNPRGKHPTYVYYETYNYGPTNVVDAWYRTDYYLSTDSTINSSDILIGSYESKFDVAVGQTEIHNLVSTWRNRITIPETLPSRSYYFGVHVVPVSGSPSEPDDSDNWNRGNTVVIPLEVILINNSSRSIYYFYMRPYNNSSWGSDLLGSSTVPSGSSFSVNLNRGSTDKWDLKAQDSSGATWIADDQNIGDSYKLTYMLTNTSWTTTWYK